MYIIFACKRTIYKIIIRGITYLMCGMGLSVMILLLTVAKCIRRRTGKQFMRRYVLL